MNKKIATILPLHHLDEIRDDSYFMALSHACENEEYLKFFRERAKDNRYVILDNSAVETGAPEDFKTYMEKATAIGVSSIMLPDVFQDARATLDSAYWALDDYALDIKLLSMDVMVIPQGRSIDEWLKNAKDLSDIVLDRGMSPIFGISCRYTSMFGGTRSLAILLLHHHRNEYLKIHLLGCYADPRIDVRPILNFHFITGVDSSYAAVYTENILKITPESLSGTRPSRNINFLTDTYDVELLRDNIKAWRLACGN